MKKIINYGKLCTKRGMNLRIRADDLQNVRGVLNVINDDITKNLKLEIKSRLYNYKG